MLQKILQRNKLLGFTLLETLGSVAILSLAIIGPLSVTISSSGYARITKDKIIATYLAEEAVELLQNQYDSLYVYCTKYATSTQADGYCDPALAPGTETSAGQTAWRLFKNKLSDADGQTTCYLPKGETSTSYPGNSAGNENGCAFDYVNMRASSTEVLTRYDASSNNCKSLVPVATTTTRYIPNTTGGGQYGGNTGDEGEGEGTGGGQTPSYTLVTSTTTSYVCSGETSRNTEGVKVQNKDYFRYVTVDNIPTYETGNADQQYNDDLRITSTVEFKAINGVTHNVKITRFMHARP